VKINLLNDNMKHYGKLKMDYQQLERTKQECSVLEQRYETSQRELLHIQDQMGREILSIKEHGHDEVKLRDSHYENLKKQFNEERA
jgi:hypothetical protein